MDLISQGRSGFVTVRLFLDSIWDCFGMRHGGVIKSCDLVGPRSPVLLPSNRDSIRVSGVLPSFETNQKYMYTFVGSMYQEPIDADWILGKRISSSEKTSRTPFMHLPLLAVQKGMVIRLAPVKAQATARVT